MLRGVRLARPLALVALAAFVLLVSGSRAHGSSQAATYHLLFTSSRDGDDDIYAVDMRSRQPSALTRNNADDVNLVASPSGDFYVERLRTGGFLVSPDGRRERSLGEGIFNGGGTFSPDGRQLAVARTDAFETDHMMLVPVRGGPARLLGRGRPDVFSRDGRRLSFYARGGRPGVTDLLTGQRRLFAWPPGCCAGNRWWVWSPELTRFAYVREDPSDFALEELVVVGARPPAPATVVVRGRIVEWVWLDEGRIAVERDQDLLVIDVASNSERVVASDVRDWAASARGALAHVDGEGVLVVTSPDGGRRRSQLVPELIPHRLGSVIWSPRSDRLAVSGTTSKGSTLLYVLDLKPAWRLRSVAPGLRGDILSMAWSPDGHLLALDNRGVVLVSVTAGQVRRIGIRPEYESFAWARGLVPLTARPMLPVPPPETGGAVFRSRGSVLEISASGPWVAAVVGDARAACTHVVAWRAGGRLVRFRQDFLCENDSLADLELNGTRLAWIRSTRPCGLSGCYVQPYCADLRQPRKGCRAGDEIEEAEQPPRPRPRREVHRGLVMTLRDGVVEVRRRADRRHTVIRVPTSIADAELEDAGLFYAWNDGQGSGRVAFIPFGELVDRLTS